MSYTSLCFTHPGHIREINEDSYFINNESNLWLVCDGMGGHEKGNFASRLVTDIFSNFEIYEDLDTTISVIKQQIYKIHNIMLEKFQFSDDLAGTTFTLLHINNNKAVCIYLGDTRCYLLRDNIIKQINEDHCKTIIDESGDTRKVLTSAISSAEDIFVDVIEFDVENEDKFLICTDGLYDNVSESDILISLIDENNKNGLEQLKEKVLNTQADDNLTAIQIGHYYE